MLIKRLFKLLKRKRMATKLGISFNRCSSFKLPCWIAINEKSHKLFLPDENGVRVAFIELLLDDCYGCRKLGQSVGTVLDIGANVGLFGLAARNAFPNALIHAYEPNRLLEKYLKTQSDSARFNYFIEAVGLENGTISLDINEDSVQTRSRLDEHGKIPQISFRETINRLGGHVDFLKMDCEGAEWQIFQDKESWKRVGNLSMEYHLWPDHSHDEIKNVIQGLGFRIQKFFPITDFGLLNATRR